MNMKKTDIYICKFAVALIAVRVIRGDYRADFELERQSEREEKDDQFFL